MNYIYRNDTDHAVIYGSDIWQPGECLPTSCPLPDSLGLTCIFEGSPPDPVLFHEDLLIQAGSTAVAVLDAPASSLNVALNIQCMSNYSGAECCFGSPNNKPIPIDTRGFEHVLTWCLCSKLFFRNTTENEALISITAVEVIS